MRWRYSRFSSLEGLIRELLRILRQLLVVFDGDVEESLDGGWIAPFHKTAAVMTWGGRP